MLLLSARGTPQPTLWRRSCSESCAAPPASLLAISTCRAACKRTNRIQAARANPRCSAAPEIRSKCSGSKRSRTGSVCRRRGARLASLMFLSIPQQFSESSLGTGNAGDIHPSWQGRGLDLLWDLCHRARQLTAEEPQLVGALTLIRDSFAAIANSWEGFPLSPKTSQAITPRVVAAVTKALEEPRTDTFDELAKVLIWAREYPLTDGAGEEIPTN
jgi:hypothetical protein